MTDTDRSGRKIRLLERCVLKETEALRGNFKRKLWGESRWSANSWIVTGLVYECLWLASSLGFTSSEALMAIVHHSACISYRSIVETGAAQHKLMIKVCKGNKDLWVFSLHLYPWSGRKCIWMTNKLYFFDPSIHPYAQTSIHALYIKWKKINEWKSPEDTKRLFWTDLFSWGNNGSVFKYLFTLFTAESFYMAWLHADVKKKERKENCTHIYTQEGVVCAIKGTNDLWPCICVPSVHVSQTLSQAVRTIQHTPRENLPEEPQRRCLLECDRFSLPSNGAVKCPLDQEP